MPRSRWLAAAAAVVLLVGARGRPAAAEGFETAVLRAREDAQRRARELARDLVSSVIDVQLRQLEENGLQALDLYGDVRALRDNVNGLVEAEMQRVIDLLVRAQAAAPADRRELVTEARRTVREVVVRLSLERQGVIRRLKTVDLAWQVKRLLAMQSDCHQATRALSIVPRDRAEAGLLDAAQDQRDVKAVLERLVEILAAACDWNGPIGAAATAGLALVRSRDVVGEAGRACESLDAAAPAAAEASQKAVLDTLRLLLARVEAAQGFGGADDVDLVRAIRELSARQDDLRAASAAATGEVEVETDGERLVDAQALLGQDLAKLGAQAVASAAAQRHIEQSSEAAYRAAEQLFAGSESDARTAQDDVLRALEAAEAALGSASVAARSGRSAAGERKLREGLDALLAGLAAARDREAEALSLLSGDPTLARAAQESEVAAMRDLPLPASPPPAVAASVDRARDAVRAAASSLPPSRESVAGAVSAIEDSVAETTRARDEVLRRESALAAGELLRAAESLDRAAGVERDVARGASAAASAPEGVAERAAGLAARSQKAMAVGAAAADAVRPLAPEVADAVRDAAGEAAAAGASLARAAAASADAAEGAASAVAAEGVASAVAAEGAASAVAAEGVASAVAAEGVASGPEQGREMARAAGAAARAAVGLARAAAAARAAASRHAAAIVRRAAEGLERAGGGVDSGAAGEGVARRLALERDVALGSSLGESVTAAQDAAEALGSAASADAAEGAASAAAAEGAASAVAREGAASAVAAEGAASAVAAEGAASAVAREVAAHRFSQALASAGQAVEEVSGQREVASSALRDALAAASGLAPSGAPAGSAAMGTGFVPESAEATAALLGGQSFAGRPASDGAARDGRGGDSGRNERSRVSPEAATESSASAAPGSAASDARDRRGPLDPAPRRPDPPWLLRLPPEVRAAFRAGAQRPPPRAYQERLRRYFESVD